MGEAKNKIKNKLKARAMPHKFIGMVEDIDPHHCQFSFMTAKNSYGYHTDHGDESSIKLALKKIKL